MDTGRASQSRAGASRDRDRASTSRSARPERSQAVYVISVAAELVGMHPQTLRIYERKGLLDPSRTSGGSRRFSERDLERLRRIQELTNAGLNLEGVRRVLELERGGVRPARRARARTDRGPGGRRAHPPHLPTRPRAGQPRPRSVPEDRAKVERLTCHWTRNAGPSRRREALAAATQQAAASHHAEVTPGPPAGSRAGPAGEHRRAAARPGGNVGRRRPAQAGRGAGPDAPRRGWIGAWPRSRRPGTCSRPPTRCAGTWGTTTSRSSTCCSPGPSTWACPATSCSRPCARCGVATGSPRPPRRRRSRRSRSTDGT